MSGYRITVSVAKEGATYLSLSFGHQPVTLGASSRNDVVLTHPFVSAEHGLVTVSREQLVYQDGSTNGSFVEGRRVHEVRLGASGTVAIPPFDVTFGLHVDEDSAWRTQRRPIGVEPQVPQAVDVLPESAPKDPEPVPALRPLAPRPPASAPEVPATGPASSSAGRPPVPDLRGEATGKEISPVPVPLPGSSYSVAARASSAPPPDASDAAPPPLVPAYQTPSGPVEVRGPEPAIAPRFLVVLDGPAAVAHRSYPLDRDLIRIGRDSQAEVSLGVSTVSREHAVLTRVDSATWRLRDLGSANGTLVGANQVETALLREGDVFTVGRAATFRLSAEPGAARVTGSTSGTSRPAPPTATPPEPEGSVLSPLRMEFRRGGTRGVVLVAEVAGRVDVCSYAAVAERLQQAIDAGERLIVLSLAGLHFIDHAGLGVLVQASSRLDGLDGRLVLAGMRPKLRETFSLSRLDVVFRNRIFDDEAGAIAEVERTARSSRGRPGR